MSPLCHLFCNFRAGEAANMFIPASALDVTPLILSCPNATFAYSHTSLGICCPLNPQVSLSLL